MKLIDILKEINISDLTPDQKRELFKQGSLMVPLPTDPNRPSTSGSEVINLPKMDQIKREILKNKQEFDVFMFSPDEDIQLLAKEINKYYNKLYRAMNALDKTIELKKRDRI